MRLGQIARKLNVGTTTIIQLLEKNGHVIENNPNSKVTNDLFVLLEKELKRSSFKKEELTHLLIENDNQPLNEEKFLIKSPSPRLKPFEIALEWQKFNLLLTMEFRLKFF